MKKSPALSMIVVLVVLLTIGNLTPIAKLPEAIAQNPLPPTQDALFYAVQENGPNIFRYQVTSSGAANLELTFTHSSFNTPGRGIAFSPRGEMFISNIGPTSAFLASNQGFISRFLDAAGDPVFSGTIDSGSFGSPIWMTFKGDELFVVNGGNNDVMRFVIDDSGNAVLNGTITAGLGGPAPPLGTAGPRTRSVAFAPWGELFVSKCCGEDEIFRYLFDSDGNAVPNGSIKDGSLSGTHGIAFSPWGELFVANLASGSIGRYTFDASHNASFNGSVAGSTISGPIDIAFSPWGELFVSDYSGQRISRFVFDSSHNASPSGAFYPPSRVIAIAFASTDSTPPATGAALSPQANGAGWHNADVTVTLAAEDEGGTGVREITYSAAGAQTIPQTTTAGASASVTVTAEGETVLTYFATDNAGNVEAARTFTVKIDKTPPQITIMRPADGAAHTLGQTVAALYSCADGGSGVAACAGPVTSGDNIDTAAVGAKSFTVTARDAAGNESAPRTAAYAVGYAVDALYDQTKVHKSGSTIPIKLRLIDAVGGTRSAPALVVQATSVYLLSTGVSGTLEDAGDANPDFNFRYDASLEGYIFNLKTTGYATGTYALSFTVSGDPTVHTVQFQVKG